MNLAFPSLSIILVGIGILLLWWIPARQTRPLHDDERLKQFDAENEARRTLAQVLGGLLVLTSLYFSSKTLAVSQEGQLTDRFVKSLDLLGKSSIESRLGGVYSLERIARDSERDHAPIMSILAASARDSSVSAASSEASPYLQAILTVITRRNLRNEDDQTRYIDLRLVTAPSVFLMYGSFVRINLFQGALPGADLRHAQFNRFYGEGLKLRGADLRSVVMSADVNFKDADFSRAELSFLVARHVYFEGAKFQNTILRGTRLEQCNFKNADLSGAVLDRTNLEYSYFRGADLRGLDLRHASLRGANLVGARLEGVQVTRAQISRLSVDDAGKAQMQVSER